MVGYGHGFGPTRPAAHLLAGAGLLPRRRRRCPPAGRPARPPPGPPEAPPLADRARDRLPEADRSKLAYRLAKAAALAGDDPGQVLDRLKRAVEAGSADDPAEAFGLLAQTYLRLNPPDLQAAYDATQ